MQKILRIGAVALMGVYMYVCVQYYEHKTLASLFMHTLCEIFPELEDKIIYYSTAVEDK